MAFYIQNPEKMVKVLNIKCFLVWSLIIVMGHSCKLIRLNQNVSADYEDIGAYLSLDVVVELPQDTLIFDDEILITIIFKNRTDTSFYFLPDALISLPRDLDGVFVNDINFTVLSNYTNINNIVLMSPFGSYSKTYKLLVQRPWCIPGINRFHVNYLCNAPKIEKQKLQYKILYGRLYSPKFEIFIKDQHSAQAESV